MPCRTPWPGASAVETPSAAFWAILALVVVLGLRLGLIRWLLRLMLGKIVMLALIALAIAYGLGFVSLPEGWA